jgi:hypothetical protein
VAWRSLAFPSPRPKSRMPNTTRRSNFPTFSSRAGLARLRTCRCQPSLANKHIPCLLCVSMFATGSPNFTDPYLHSLPQKPDSCLPQEGEMNCRLAADADAEAHSPPAAPTPPHGTRGMVRVAIYTQPCRALHTQTHTASLYLLTGVGGVQSCATHGGGLCCGGVGGGRDRAR